MAAGFRAFIANLYFGATDQDVMDWFSDIGAVQPVTVKIITERNTGQSKGYGFAEWADRGDGERAVVAANGMTMMGRKIVCNEARPMERREGGRR